MRESHIDSIFRDETLAGDARSIVTVSFHFQELKKSATLLSQSSAARQRGYFLPSEEEQVKHLLVSYWQARCALIEVVTSTHRRSQVIDANREAEFLVAFAGALVLIDAARFLRENFHENHFIRNKLNEPEPNFGLPEGIYDTVQESLTRPIHIWYLYYAIHFWEQNQAQLRAKSEVHPINRDLLAIIDGLLPTLQVTIQSYAAARLRVRTRQAWTSINRDLFARALYGLQKLAGDVVAHVYVRPGHRPGLPTHIVQELGRLLIPGDVIVSRRDYAMTNYFLPGHWPHAALFLGSIDDLEKRGLAANSHFQPRWQKLLSCDSQEPKRVLEAMKDGVLIRSFRSPCSTDSVVILRPQLTLDQIDEALARGMFHEGKSYDFSFDFTRSDRLVCTEVIYRAYQGIGGVSFQLSRRAGRMTLSAGDLLEMALGKIYFRVVGVYAQAAGNQVLQNDLAEAVVRKAIN